MVTQPSGTSDQPPALSKVVAESAGAFAIASVLLFTWGFAADSATYFYRGVPYELIPKRPVHEYLMDGGSIALLLFVLPLLVLDGVARAIERQRGKSFAWHNLARNMTPRQLVVAVTAAWFISALVASWTAQALVTSSERARVVSVRLAAGQAAPQYRGLMLAAYVDGRYVLVDRFAREAKVHIVNADDIAEIQLESWAPQQNAQPKPAAR